MTVTTTPDDWKKKASSYKSMTGGLNVKPITVMLECLNSRFPLASATGILDDGCGPGPIMTRIIDEFGKHLPAECTLACSDFAPAMVDQVQEAKRRFVADEPGSVWGRVRTEVLDCMDLATVGDGEMSHVAAGWSFFNANNPQKALSESLRVLQPGGVLAASSWAETDWLKILRTITKIDPARSPPAIPEDWANAGNLVAQLEIAGFRDVDVYEVPVDIPFRSYASFVDVMMTRVTQMMTASQDLDERQKTLLRELMTEEMKGLCPTEPGVLKAVSLVAVGVKS
ncbi:class I SAM-dependent methyltransferase [Aspergillus alliaceus]|uniref:class I SAM-dependent methyltransferase n=1 Tax=Petromyces alliaceus TaxID=209559 RepID=UPI0012A746D1|nr:S-adenosyl-L-methionine-dependent methyltransferase [Aspergillus alliaceus]KAB8227682.1 S-adenosyl-L-methionine-dependent methyltransferase [Aspergillus alliaceus]